MRAPNLYFTKSGQRQCLKCKQALGREYRAAHKDRLKKQRKQKLAEHRTTERRPPRPPRANRSTITRSTLRTPREEPPRAKATRRPKPASTIIEGHDV